MRRADRLYRISEYLKARRSVVTAQQIADEMEVNIRTVYRDMADLMASGAPITGEAGVGYMFDQSFLLKPLTFTIDELDALVVGAQILGSWGDKELGKHAKSALDKIASTLPANLHREMMEVPLFSPSSGNETELKVSFTEIRNAIRQKHKIDFDYFSLSDERSHRVIRPLCMTFFRGIWLLTGWCELRNDFRNFRLDRVDNVIIMEEKFADEKGKRLCDYEMCEG